MPKDSWWSKDEYEIEQIENDEHHVTYLCGREIDGSWEYAIVDWRYHSPNLRLRFKDGKVLEDSEA
ncbi:MAG TPA: hypothetical protein VEF04_22920 [Blastocatellia bacterium]|nr:hypothetical protein [Blastocatellia bacterium]